MLYIRTVTSFISGRECFAYRRQSLVRLIECCIVENVYDFSVIFKMRKDKDSHTFNTSKVTCYIACATPPVYIDYVINVSSSFVYRIF